MLLRTAATTKSCFVLALVLLTLLIFALSSTSSQHHEELEVESELFTTSSAMIKRVKTIKRRLVHLDLKGAKPKIDFLTEKLFPLLKSAGATGLLIEYEDTFPYEGEIKSASALNAMTKSEVKAILRAASELQLEVVPLVQTFGHLEHLLKLDEFKSLRESPLFPQSICPSQDDSFKIISEMINQVLALHPNASFVHLGCDEVFHLGVCQKCRAKLRKINENRKIPLQGRSHLFLNHVNRLIEHVKRIRPNITPMIWDDMLRSISIRDLSKLNDVQPVTWAYGENINIDDAIWRKYQSVFPRIWAASAFKGAFGERLLLPPIEKHLKNNLAWLELMNRRANFEGIILTGWSRYDHFAALCELLPSSIPSLIVALAASSGLENRVDKLLNCPFRVMDAVLSNHPQRLYYDLRTCQFPGSEVFTIVHDLSKLRADISKELYHQVFTEGGGLTGFGITSGAWMSDFGVSRNITSTWRLSEPLRRQKIMLRAVEDVEKRAKKSLTQIFERATVVEWIEENVFPLKTRMSESIKSIEALTRRISWPRRPYA